VKRIDPFSVAVEIVSTVGSRPSIHFWGRIRFLLELWQLFHVKTGEGRNVLALRPSLMQKLRQGYLFVVMVNCTILRAVDSLNVNDKLKSPSCEDARKRPLVSQFRI
jgi:hypothetical protein